VIVDAVRTPVGRRGGVLAHWHPTDLLAQTLRCLLDRVDIDEDAIADVIIGCVMQNGDQAGNLARWAALGAGLPESVPATTIDRQCGSGQQAIHFAAQAVRAGDYRFALAGGVESMSRVELGPLFNPAAGPGPWYGERSLHRYDGNLGAQGPAADVVARKWGLARTQLDDFSARSHERAAAATAAGHFASQLVPVTGTDGATVSGDEGIRANLDRVKIAGLAPVFADDGLITAANASQISDGAAAVLIASRDAAAQAGLPVRATIRAMAVAADDPQLQFTAVIPAAHKALQQAGLQMSDIDRVEVNEAFACVPLGFQQAFDVADDRLNVNGGSIAVGHPLGSTGARMMTDLVVELERSAGHYGLLVICEGGGMANATIIERAG
jgi:acetyl-CoA C-acetyltransferase